MTWPKVFALGCPWAWTYTVVRCWTSQGRRENNLRQDGCISYEHEELGEHHTAGAGFYAAVFSLSDHCICSGKIITLRDQY